jgi:type 1 glutamine amidotransferase
MQQTRFFGRMTCLIVSAVAAIGFDQAVADQAAGSARKVRVLLTVDGSHGWAAKEPIFMSLVGKTGAFEVTRSKDLNDWLPERIRQYDLVVVHTTGGNLSDAQVNGLTRFVEAGGGFVGIHSATDSFKKCDKYWALIGGRFTGHASGRFTVEVADPWDPIMTGVADFEVQDEDYQHKYYPNVDLHILARKKGDNRNMGWTRKIDRGRLVYLANGHGSEAFQVPAFQTMLINSMYWASHRPVPGSGCIALFDGTDMKRWKPEPTWYVEDGLLRNRPHAGPNLQSVDVFDDFVVRFDWKVVPNGNSGFFIRGDTEIQLLDDFAKMHEHIKPCQHTGSVYCNIPAKTDTLKKAGQWNDMQILAKGKKVQVWLNGLKVVDGSFNDTDELKTRAMRGPFIIQNYGKGGGLTFRDIEVKLLTQGD